MSQELFEIEVLKILYIRDHCKEIVYDIIKSRANLKAADYYDIAKEIIINLEQNFDNFNKKDKANVDL